MSAGSALPRPPVRVGAKALILDRGDVLLLEMRDAAGAYFMLPGGGQENGESLPEAVRRECLEEIGAEVEVHDVVLMRDYVEAHHEFAAHRSGFHQVDVVFRCTIKDRAAAKVGVTPDTRQVGIRWVPVGEVGRLNVFPKCLAAEVPRIARGEAGRVYLGDVN